MKITDRMNRELVGHINARRGLASTDIGALQLRTNDRGRRVLYAVINENGGLVHVGPAGGVGNRRGLYCYLSGFIWGLNTGMVDASNRLADQNTKKKG